MRAETPDLERRRLAVEAVQKRFAGKAFMLGRRDCIRMAAIVLRAMGHKVPAIPPYKSEITALRRLKEQGASNVAELLDQLGLQRIPPASALVGDLIWLPSDGAHDIGGVSISTGNGTALGFHEALPGLVAYRPLELSIAWSVAR